MPTPRAINPIIPGFAPDPSIVSVSGWYFLVTSSFHLFPGLPIYASDDLVSWKHIGNAINRQAQLSLAKSSTRLSAPSPSTGGKILPATAGLYAPTIRHHDGTFHIVCTNAVFQKETGVVDKHNFVISTTDIWRSTWSDPVYFDFVGIDPDLFFEDGTTYITGSATPGPWTRINCFEIDIETGRALSEERTIWRGSGGVYPEGPHIYKRNGWYYLLIAEDGTHVTHMITMARSRSIWGPYEPCPRNPVLTARDTDEYIQHTGHGDLFQDYDGHWWAVCLGVRKDTQGRYAMSRETFLTPAEWEDEWPSLATVKLSADASNLKHERFSLSVEPGVDYVYIRDALFGHYNFDAPSSSITLTATSVDLSDPQASPSFVGKRQRLLQGTSGVVVANISDAWASGNLKGGLAYYKDEHRHFRIFFDASDTSIVFQEKNEAQEVSKTTRHALERVPENVSLLMKYTEQEFHLLYALNSEPERSWIRLAVVDTLDMTDPDFVGPVIGIFAVADTEGLEVGFRDFHCD
ncbi:glycosyl hydrolase [Fusarium solani]|uniref:Glycosyl hydrolase n=1 Tax=Fusarium solani TaxID=169388 RepID=A0A9P9KDF3_FUSSL|nr:glycosyl hydrolase [Fusarium solani]KAH7253275.1 glycosyl hydrolase [Fusarium solani]